MTIDELIEALLDLWQAGTPGSAPVLVPDHGPDGEIVIRELYPADIKSVLARRKGERGWETYRMMRYGDRQDEFPVAAVFLDSADL